MWLDTGAQITTLTTDAARRLSLSLTMLNGSVEGIGGRSTAYGFVARSFQIGRLRGRNFQLVASDLGLSHRGIPTDGLLGDDFLAAYDVDLDLPDGKAILFKTAGDCSRPGADLGGELYTVPMFAGATSNDLRPHVRVSIAGKTLVAILDTGAPGSVLFRDTARKIGLQPASLATDPQFHTSGVGQRSPGAVLHVLTPIEIGDLTVSHLPVAIIDQAAPADSDMLLGLDFLARVHTWLSFSSHTVIFQYPALSSPVRAH